MSHPHPELTSPPQLATGDMRIVALGGLGEIGRNMTVFESHGQLLIVDCGVLFPEESQPGIDLILPDFSYIRERLNDVIGIVLTHGHEDHIGAVPYLLRERGDIAIYGSALTIALISAKLKEHRISPFTREVKEGDGGIDYLPGLNAKGRCVRLDMKERGSPWGYSLWEFEIYE